MIDISLIRNNPKQVAEKLLDRLKNPAEAIEEIVMLDTKWKKVKQDLDSVNTERKKITGKGPDAIKLKKQHAENEQRERELREQIETELSKLPNIPFDETPRGSSKNNVEVRVEGKVQKKSGVKDYLTLAKSSDWLDMEAGAQASGARFSYLKGIAAKLSFALQSYGIKILTEEGFTLVAPPTIIKKETMKKMGYLDQAGEQEIFQIKNSVGADELVLIGTAEQAIGGMLMNRTYPEISLPARFMAFTPCYRREAGSYGKDTRGILRQHQFEKLEMFSVTTEEASKGEHEYLVALQEKLMKGLKLPYRVLDLASGDLGFPSARTFDIETWLPGQLEGKGEYRETHSSSNCTDYQARRLRLRYKTKEGTTRVCHTLNGTAFAMQRMIIAIVENYQKSDGSIEIPEVLRPYF